MGARPAERCPTGCWRPSRFPRPAHAVELTERGSGPFTAERPATLKWLRRRPAAPRRKAPALMSKKRIFVSATTRDLGSYRELASRSLRKRGYDVDDQAIFNLTYPGDPREAQAADRRLRRGRLPDRLRLRRRAVEPPARSAPALVHPVGVLPCASSSTSRSTSCWPTRTRPTSTHISRRARRTAATPAQVLPAEVIRDRDWSVVCQHRPTPCRAGRAALPLGAAAAGAQAQQPAAGLDRHALQGSRGIPRRPAEQARRARRPGDGHREPAGRARARRRGQDAGRGRVRLAARRRLHRAAVRLRPDAGRAPHQPGEPGRGAGDVGGNGLGRRATCTGARLAGGSSGLAADRRQRRHRGGGPGGRATAGAAPGRPRADHLADRQLERGGRTARSRRAGTRGGRGVPAGADAAPPQARR